MKAASEQLKRLEENDLLKSGITLLDLDNHEYLYTKLLIYIDLLIKWNKTYNLTSLTTKEDIITTHLLDCLSVVKKIDGQRILDVGSGAGLPGLMIALARPTTHLCLIDKVAKKTSFMKQAVLELELSNVEVIHGRVEDLRVKNPFDTIVSRAFSEVEKFISLTQHLISKQGAWLIMKSKKIMTEDLKKLDKAFEVEPITVPYLEAERYLVRINNKA
ncbi:MAG: 16S rRNA (guanine(527)-N(7))-methyltransferase RsmG [Methylophilaceae bacterium]